MFKALVYVSMLTLTLGTASLRAQVSANDALTEIPVFPSAAGGDERIPGGICRITAQTVIYYVPFLWGPNHTAAPKQIAVADVEQWYQTHLKDFRLVPGFDGQRTQDVLLSPYGTKAITITGQPAGPAAYAISFTLFSARVQPSQVKSFASHQMIQC